MPSSATGEARGFRRWDSSPDPIKPEETTHNNINKSSSSRKHKANMFGTKLQKSNKDNNTTKPPRAKGRRMMQAQKAGAASDKSNERSKSWGLDIVNEDGEDSPPPTKRRIGKPKNLFSRSGSGVGDGNNNNKSKPPTPPTAKEIGAEHKDERGGPTVQPVVFP